MSAIPESVERRRSHRKMETFSDAFVQLVEIQRKPGEDLFIDVVEGGTLHVRYFDPGLVEAEANDLDLRGVGPIENHFGPVTKLHEKLREFQADPKAFSFFADWFDGTSYGGRMELLRR